MIKNRSFRVIGVLFVFYGLLASLILGSGCTSLVPTTVPVGAILSTNSKLPASQSRLIVMLPGRHSRGSNLEREGISRELTQLRDTDFVAVDLHFGYYRNRSFLERLREDIILPARKKGYREIHLLGVSMGGMGALFYATQYPDEVDALALLSPFVGDEEIMAEIESAGGLSSWTPGEISETDYQRKLWASLRGLHPDGARGRTAPRVWMACGQSDRLFESNAFFARQFRLPKPDGFYVIEGDHDWESWRTMEAAYRRLLDR